MTANRLGIDLSQDYFDLVLAKADGQLVSQTRRFDHDRIGSQQALAYVLDLCQQHPADELWIGAESTGMLWWHLFQNWALEPDLQARSTSFFLLNPNPVKQFRKTAALKDKDDPIDARLLTRYLGIPDHELVSWLPDLEHWPLRFLTRFRCRLAQHLVVLKLRAYSLLYIKASAYQLVEPFGNPLGVASCHILREYPSLEALAQVPMQDLVEKLETWSRNCLPDAQLNAHKLGDVVRRSYPIPDQLAEHVHFILSRTLDLIDEQQKQMKKTDRFLIEHYGQDPDIAHLDSIPGIGPVFAAGLTAEGRPTERFCRGRKYEPQRGEYLPRTWADAQAAFGKLAGLWWPRNRSGDSDSQERHMPRACNPYLRYYLVEGAYHVREHVAEYALFYQQKYREARKHPQRRAMVLTARKLARLVFALLHRHEAYQPRRVNDN